MDAVLFSGVKSSDPDKRILRRATASLTAFVASRAAAAAAASRPVDAVTRTSAS